MAFQKAEYSLRRNSFAEAETYARIAFECDPDTPEHIAVWHWLRAMKPDANLQECLAAIDRAAAKTSSEWVLFSRGMVRKLVGKTDLSVGDFRQVLEINPRNIDAAREVRVYEMRAASAKSLVTKTSNVLSSFLRKKGPP
jgi:tetratricopeptide (TPR) repeat protein